jgi:hypothetical protein
MEEITIDQVATVVDNHDKFLFSVFVSIAIFQEVLIEKGIITKEELQALAEVRTKEALAKKFEAEGLLQDNKELQDILKV